MRRIELRGLTVIVVTCAAACAMPEATPHQALARSDSGGIELVSSAGGEVVSRFPAAADSFLMELDGTPRIFSGSSRQWVRVSPHGDVFVIASDLRAILRFDAAGHPVSQIGKRGNGPGEMMLPLTLMLRGDTVAVVDATKRALLRWSSYGDSLLGQLSWPENQKLGTVLALAGENVLSVGEMSERRQAWGTVGWTGRPHPLIAFAMPPIVLINLPCDSRPTERAAILSPRLHISTLDETAVVAGTERYELWVSDRNRLVRSIRREIESRPPTKSEVSLAAGRGYRLTMNGRKCSVSATELIERVGVASVFPAIHGLSLTADGSIWVLRTFSRETAGTVDQFSLGGTYLRTWHNASLPLGSLPDGRLLVPREDEESGGTLIELVRLR